MSNNTSTCLSCPQTHPHIEQHVHMSNNNFRYLTTHPHIQPHIYMSNKKSRYLTTHPHVHGGARCVRCALCCSSADLWWWWWVSFYLFLINQHLISFSWGCSVFPSPNRVLKWSCPFSTWGAMSCLLGEFLDPPLDNTCPTSVQVPKYRVKPLGYISV